MADGRCGFPIALVAVLAASGCAPPLNFVPVPVEPASTHANEKRVGTTRLQPVRGDELVQELPPGLVPTGLSSTLAQSGQGSLGDRLFRLDAFGFLEGCRWVPKGRVCDLVTLPDGTFFGGSVHWVVPSAAAATPRASGWVAQGTFFAASFASGSGANADVGLRTPVLLGRAYHCRFADAGPQCIPVPVTSTALGFAILGSFSLHDGPAQREVLWIGLLPVGNTGTSLEIRELHRCETTEDANEVICKLVSMK
jgi:hypothetical protein